MELERIVKNHPKIELGKAIGYGKLFADSHQNLPDLEVINDIDEFIKHGDINDH